MRSASCGASKLFHPYLATRDIDWDAALIGALTKARNVSAEGCTDWEPDVRVLATGGVSQ